MNRVKSRLKNPLLHVFFPITADHMVQKCPHCLLPCLSGMEQNGFIFKIHNLHSRSDCSVRFNSQIKKGIEMVFLQKIKHNIQFREIVIAGMDAIGQFHLLRKQIPDAHIPKTKVFCKKCDVVLDICHQNRSRRPYVHGVSPDVPVIFPDFCVCINGNALMLRRLFLSKLLPQLFQNPLIQFPASSVCRRKGFLLSSPVFGRRYPVSFPEHAVESGKIGKSAFYGDFCNALTGKRQFPAGITEPQLLYIICKINPCFLLK